MDGLTAGSEHQQSRGRDRESQPKEKTSTRLPCIALFIVRRTIKYYFTVGAIMPENEDWESERIYGHTIERPRGEYRCQVKAKIQCVLQEHMSKDKALQVAEEVVTELIEK